MMLIVFVSVLNVEVISKEISLVGRVGSFELTTHIAQRSWKRFAFSKSQNDIDFDVLSVAWLDDFHEDLLLFNMAAEMGYMNDVRIVDTVRNFTNYMALNKPLFYVDKSFKRDNETTVVDLVKDQLGDLELRRNSRVSSSLYNGIKQLSEFPDRYIIGQDIVDELDVLFAYDEVEYSVGEYLDFLNNRLIRKNLHLKNVFYESMEDMVLYQYALKELDDRFDNLNETFFLEQKKFERSVALEVFMQDLTRVKYFNNSSSLDLDVIWEKRKSYRVEKIILNEYIFNGYDEAKAFFNKHINCSYQFFRNEKDQKEIVLLKEDELFSFYDNLPVGQCADPVLERNCYKVYLKRAVARKYNDVSESFLEKYNNVYKKNIRSELLDFLKLHPDISAPVFYDMNILRLITNNI